jgi:hypothetical protein
MGLPELGWTGRVTTLSGRRVGVGPVSSMAGRPRRHPYPGHLWGIGEHLVPLVLPSHRPAPWHGTGSLGRPGGERGPPRPGRWRPSPSCQPSTPTHDHPVLAGSARAGDHAARGPTAARRTCCAQRRLPTAPTHSSIQRFGQRGRRPRTPEACPSGHPDRTSRVDTGRVDTGRPPDYWTDARTADRRRGPGDYRRGRRPDSGTATATATAGWAPKPRLGCRICGARQPMTARGDDTCRRGDWAAAQQCST